MITFNRFIVFVLLCLFVAVFTENAAACATCFGAPGDAQTEGMNAAIWTLLGVTSGVLSIAGSFFGVVLWRLSHFEQPPHGNDLQATP